MACETEAQIAELFARLVLRAEELSHTRCPYQNRMDECTAEFVCPNQRPQKPRVLPRCVGLCPC